jgi:hypothetical protein
MLTSWTQLEPRNPPYLVRRERDFEEQATSLIGGTVKSHEVV